MNQYSISFAGAGRVAGALCRELSSTGYKIELIVSESIDSCRSLAECCNALWSQELIFPDSADVIIVSVPDHRLKGVLDRLRCGAHTLVAHTAGSIGLDVFPERIARKAIFYPLQTFSKERRVDFQDLPFFLESSDKKSSTTLEEIAKSIGGKVYYADTEHRMTLHLAAVFACNFTNHMLTVGKEVALKSGFPFEILVPLINETILKAIELGPEKSQTGPAVRNDKNIIEKHLKLLSFSSDMQRTYSDMTRAIIEYHKKL